MKHNVLKLVISLVFLFGAVSLQAQNVPSFYAGEVLQFSDSSPMIPPELQPYPQYPQYTVDNSDATPVVVDWNGDGVKDILSGYFYNGYIYYYENTGTNANPVFINDDELLLEADGSTISEGYGWCIGAIPQIADWDEDGDFDLLVGDRNGDIALYLNTGSATNPVLTFSQNIQAAGATIDVGSNSSVVVTDWNNDGNKDLVIANQDYEVRVYLNTGSNASPAFNGYTTVINTGDIYYLSPEVFDLNRDGKKDVLLGISDGRVRFYENIGTDAAPAFDTFEFLKLNSGSDIDVGSGAQLDCNDWDLDGAMDLLIGADDGQITVFINTDVVSAIDEPLAGDLRGFKLAQNYPNPFNPTTTIEYTVNKAANVRLEVFNTAGQLVKTLEEGFRNAGSYSVNWQAGGLTSGVYFYQLTAGSQVEIKKCMLIK